VGKFWASRWELKKIMLAESVSGDKRVAHVLWRIGVDLVTVVAHASR